MHVYAYEELFIHLKMCLDILMNSVEMEEEVVDMLLILDYTSNFISFRKFGEVGGREIAWR